MARILEQKAAEISLLLMENKKLREVKEAIRVERDQLQQELEMKVEENDALYAEIQELQGIREADSFEIQQLKAEINFLEKQKGEIEKTVDLMNEDKGDVLLKVLEAQTELEEQLEKKKRAVEIISGKVMKMLKRTTEMVRGWLGDDELDMEYEFVDIEEIEDEGGDERHEEALAVIVPFAAELRAIERAFRQKEWEMKEMKKQLDRLNVKVEGKGEGMTDWEWE